MNLNQRNQEIWCEIIPEENERKPKYDPLFPSLIFVIKDLGDSLTASINAFVNVMALHLSQTILKSNLCQQQDDIVGSDT